jgi:hypothetical protein
MSSLEIEKEDGLLANAEIFGALGRTSLGLGYTIMGIIYSILWRVDM